MGFSTNSSTALEQINANTDGLDALLTLIQAQTDELEVPVANIDLTLATIETLTDDLKALQTQIRDAVLTNNSSGTVTVNENAAAILAAIESALLILGTLDINVTDIEALLTRLAGDSTTIAVLSDQHFALPNTAINQLPPFIVNAVTIVPVRVDGAPNSADIQYGFNPTDLRFTLAPGGSESITAPAGKKIDTSSIYVQGVADDGVALGLMD